MRDLGGASGSKSAIHNTILDVLGYDSDIPGPSIKRQLYTDQTTWSMANG